MQVRLGAGVKPEAAGDDIPEVMRASLLGRNLTGPYHLRNQRVILGETSELPVRDEIDAAVAHVSQAELFPARDRDRHGGSHAAQGAILGSPGLDGEVRLVNRLPQQPDHLLGIQGAGRQAFFEELRDGPDGEVTGHLPGGVPSHPVGDDEDAGFLVGKDAVFVGLADPSGVSPGCDLHLSYSLLSALPVLA